MSWQTDANWEMPRADGDDCEIDWERQMVKFRGVEVPLAPRWIREWLRKYGDPWCPNHDPVRCPCWSLVHRSGDVTGFPLGNLSHVSYLVGETLTEQWILAALEHGPWDPYDCVPIPVVEGIWTHPVRFHDMIELPDDSAPGWPVPILDSPYGVAIVVREWVEEPQDPRLGQVLDGMPQLEEAIEEVRTDYCIVPTRTNRKATRSTWSLKMFIPKCACSWSGSGVLRPHPDRRAALLRRNHAAPDQ
jgi:hypothetical protein